MREQVKEGEGTVSVPPSDSVARLEDTQQPKRSRRWFQGRPRILMLLFLICPAVLLGYVLVRYEPKQREHQAVEAIKALGGRVVYNQSYPQPSPDSATRSVLGEHFDRHVVEVVYPPGTQDEHLKYLDAFRHLTSVSLNASAVTSAGLSHVLKNRKLRRLHLRSTSITDADIATFEVFSDLQELDVSHTAITKRAVQSLKHLSRLERLGLEGTHIAPEDALPLDHATVNYVRGTTWSAAPSESQRQLAIALERRGVPIHIHQRRRGNEVEYEATIFQGRLQEEILNLLEKLTVLTTLVLVDVSVSHSQWARIACVPGSVDPQEHQKDGRIDGGLPQLEMLVIRKVTISDQDMAFIGKLTDLRVLQLRDGNVTDAGLEHLRSLDKLEKLYLSELQLTDACLAGIAKLTGLRELEMRSSQLTDACMPYIAQLKELETLMIVDTQVSDAGLVHLRHLKRLKSLWLRGAPITDAGLAQLKCLEHLEYLNLGNTSITDIGLAQLNFAENLRYVDADGTNVSQAALRRFHSGKESFQEQQ